ncbi:MAG: cytochrome c [Proteobacteria bacterium]|nr:MAG: cytochrome c [Pseudomonadota bacterium]
MKTRTWIALSILFFIVASSAIYLLNAANQAKRLAASPAERGWMLIEDNGCMACHQADNNFRAPTLAGLYGSEVTLQDGTKVTADTTYIRESILEPAAKVSAGYQGTMPSFKGLLSDEEIAEITEALKKP